MLIRIDRQIVDAVVNYLQNAKCGCSGKKTAKSPSKLRQQSPTKGKQKSAKVSKSKTVSNSKTASPSASPSKAEKVTSSRSVNKRSLTKKAATDELENKIDGPEDAEKSSEMETASSEKTDGEQRTSDSRKRKLDDVEDLMKTSETEPGTKAPKLSDENSDSVSSEDKETKACEISDTNAGGDDALHSIDADTKSVELKQVEIVVSESTVGAKAEEPISSVAVNENEYEIISKDDVPPADSDEIIAVVEKMVPPPPSATLATSSNGCSGNGCNESDAPFSREFVANVAVGGELDPAQSFSIVSYNVLANCHSQKDFSGEKAPWITDEQLSQDARHQQLMKELKYLDSDIVCLQEVEGSHMQDLLIPDMEALV